MAAWSSGASAAIPAVIMCVPGTLPTSLQKMPALRRNRSLIAAISLAGCLSSSVMIVLLWCE
jgi:hypothetical protein